MPFILAVDFDGTLVEDVFPEQGEFQKDIVDKVQEFKKHGAEIALWTCREGKSLEEAMARCKEQGLEFDSINENTPSQLEFMETKKAQGEEMALHKIYADFYVDDKALNLDIFLNINVAETCKRFENR